MTFDDLAKMTNGGLAKLMALLLKFIEQNPNKATIPSLYVNDSLSISVVVLVEFDGLQQAIIIAAMTMAMAYCMHRTNDVERPSSLFPKLLN